MARVWRAPGEAPEGREGAHALQHTHSPGPQEPETLEP